MNVHHASETDDVVIACVHTIGRRGSYRIGKFKPEDFTKIIVDEAHLSVSDIYVRVLNYLEVGPDNLQKGKVLCGLTATPNRTDGVGLGLVFDEIVAKYDLAYGIRNGWLTDLDIYRVQTKTDISHVGSRKDDFYLGELSDAVNVESRNKLILKSYKDISDGESALVYCASVDHAYKLAELFRKHNISSFCIEANTKSEERNKAIAEYKQGKIKVLFNYSTLTLGFNAPETSTIILARPIKSPLLLRQIIGRGVRPSEYCFIDSFNTKEQRIKVIERSLKPACKVIDLYDIVGQHKVVSVPSLFGLNNELVKEDQTRFFKEVVEMLEEVKIEKQIDVSKIKNLNEIELLVNKERLNFKSLTPTEEVSQHTERPWLPVGSDQYEIIYPSDNKCLLIEKNQLDKYNLIEIDTSTTLARKLQEFYDLSAAVKVGDEYADRNYNTTFHKSRREWEPNGVTQKQFNLLLKLFKGGVRVDKFNKYKDTKIPHLYYRKTGELLNSGKASDLIGMRIG